jgi:aspartate carbamoyltransferase regulatory subunit
MSNANQKPTKQEEIRLTPIANGTVLDHLPVGTALKIVEILKLEPNHAISMAINTESKKHGKKDLLMMENRVLSKIEIDKVGMIAKGATLNVVENHSVKEKKIIELPKTAFGVLKCNNPNCISTIEEIQTRFSVTENPLSAKCYYCERKMNESEIKKAIK